MKHRILMASCLMLCISAASAAPAPPMPAHGAQTRAWLNVHKQASTAQSTPRPLPGEVADKIYQRYVDSFTYPIPETFPRESINSGGGSGQSR